MKVLAEVGHDARHAARHRGEDVRDALVVEGDAAARENRIVHVLVFEGGDDDVRLIHLLQREPRLTRRRIPSGGQSRERPMAPGGHGRGRARGESKKGDRERTTLDHSSNAASNPRTNEAPGHFPAQSLRSHEM